MKSLILKTISALIVAAGAGIVARNSMCRMDATAGFRNSNPQEFYLQASGSVCSYRFSYDPRKADRWEFGSGAGTMLVLKPIAPNQTGTEPPHH